jgi:WD40 repeat protein
VVACCGYWDHSIRCYAAEDGRLLQACRAHKDVVTCLALGADGRTLVSGSRDTTVAVWDVAPGAGGAPARGRARSLSLGGGAAGAPPASRRWAWAARHRCLAGQCAVGAVASERAVMRCLCLHSQAHSCDGRGSIQC